MYMKNLDDALNNKDVVFDIAVPADQLLSNSSEITIEFICSFTKTNGVKCSRGRRNT